MEKHLALVTLIILSILLLLYSILGINLLSILQNTNINYALVFSLLISTAMVSLFRGKLNKFMEYFARKTEAKGNVFSKAFILKPIIESPSDNEVKSALVELSSFIRFLHSKNIEFELSFVSQGSSKPLTTKLKVFGSDESIYDFIKINFNIFCRKWLISNEVSNSFSSSQKSSLDENPLFLKYLSVPLDYEIVVYGGEVSSKTFLRKNTPTLESICLGIIANSEDLYCLKLSDFLRHTLIVGATGSGKTTTAAIISKKVLDKGKSVIILDWHGEYWELFKKLNVKEKYLVLFSKEKPLRINPFRIGEKQYFGEYVESLIDILESVLQLTPPQTYFLYETLLRSKNSGKDRIDCFDKLYEKLKEFYDSEGYSGREARYALIRKIRPLTLSTAHHVFSGMSDLDSVFDLQAFDAKIFIVDLSWISNLTLKKLYSLFLIKEIYDKASSLRSTAHGLLKLIVVIDEAHNILTSENELMERVFSEIRKYGVGLIAISQSIIDVPNYVLRNTNLKIFHTLKSFKDVKEVCSIMPPNVNVQNLLVSLGVGEVLIYDNYTNYPIKVKIKQLP